LNITCNPKSINFVSNGIEITGSKYTINKVEGSTEKIEEKEGFLIDGGACKRSVRIKFKSGEVNLTGT